MLSKSWDRPSVYPMILKLLITGGNITLIPKEATQEKGKENNRTEKNVNINDEENQKVKMKND